MNTTYWANAPSKECVNDVDNRINSFYRVINYNTFGNLWLSSYNTYNMVMSDGGTGVRAGEQGEFVLVSVNHYRSILQRLLTMTVSERPAFEPRAINSDTKSQKQTILARGLLDYYMREKRLEKYLKQACEYALVFGEGFIEATWDATAGEVIGIDPDTKIKVCEGDIKYAAVEPIDVIRDVSAENYDECKWLVIRHVTNKWDLAAKYPEHRDRIIAADMKFSTNTIYTAYSEFQGLSDMVITYTLYHDRTPAVPDGRMVYFIDVDTILEDQPLPYRSRPVHRCAPSNYNRTPFGYTPMFDLLSLQESVNGAYSTIRTNQEAFGVPNIWIPPGASVNPTQFNGMNFISSPQKPETLNLLSTPPEMFNHAQQIVHDMETLSGVNSVARGNPEASLKSGAALALVQSMAIQSTQGIQSAYIGLLEDVGTATITILRDYASVPRVAMIAGKNNRSLMREFSGKDLAQVNRVIVDAGNPMTRTTAGKVQLAEYLIQAKQIDSPEQLLQVINTGNLDPLTEGRTNELLSIQAENEMLADGQQVPVLITDMHFQHINEHKSVLADPMSRQDPMIIEIVTAHIVEHYNQLSDPANAQLIQLMQQTPVTATPQMSNAPIVQGQQPQTPQQLVEGNMPSQPGMPNNPMTGEPV